MGSQTSAGGIRCHDLSDLRRISIGEFAVHRGADVQDDDTGCLARGFVIALKKCDLERFRVLLTSFLADIPCNARRKENERERYFSYTRYLIFRVASYYVTLHREDADPRATGWLRS